MIPLPRWLLCSLFFLLPALAGAQTLIGGLDPDGKLTTAHFDGSGNLLVSGSSGGGGSGLTDAQMRASPVPVSGTVTVGSITIGQLPASLGIKTSAASLSVAPASDAVFAVTGTVTVSGVATAANQAVANASLATIATNTGGPTPAGTNSIGQVTANAGTNLNTSALALETGGNLATIAARTPALGQASAANSTPVVQALDSGTGTVATSGAALTVDVASASVVSFRLSGTWTGSVQVQASANNANWDQVTGFSYGGTVQGQDVLNNTNCFFPVGGYRYFRWTSTGMSSGTATVTYSLLNRQATGFSVSQTAGSIGYNSPLNTPLAGLNTNALGGGAYPLATVPHLWQSTATYDVQRGNVETTLLSSSARTAATTSADQTNTNGRGVIVVLNITAASGTGGLTLRVQGKDSISGTYFNLNAAPTAVTANGIYVYHFYPDYGAATGDITQVTSRAIPRTWRASVSVGDASSYTYSISSVNIL